MEDVAKYCDRLAVMHDGEIVLYDDTDKVFSHGEELREMGLDVPEITKVASELEKLGIGIGEDVYTVKYATEKLIEKYGVDIIAIGNGTASKETEIFTVDVIKNVDRKVAYMVVSEAGASVYSASKLAAKEFPQFDLTLRSAISIARRLQDPLAELVKIDPKAIGVGQYQHDMPKKQLESALDGVVEECVNSVGADLNTASPMLLKRVA